MPIFPTDRTHVGFQASSLPYLRRLQVWVYPLVIAGGRVDLRHLQPSWTAGMSSSASSLALARARDQPWPRSVRCSAEPDTRRKPPEGAAPTAGQMRSHLDLDLMATPLWIPVKLSAAREGERFERVIAI